MFGWRETAWRALALSMPENPVSYLSPSSVLSRKSPNRYVSTTSKLCRNVPGRKVYAGSAKYCCCISVETIRLRQRIACHTYRGAQIVTSSCSFCLDMILLRLGCPCVRAEATASVSNTPCGPVLVRMKHSLMEIGMQIGPTSARKTDPPGKRFDHGELRGI